MTSSSMLSSSTTPSSSDPAVSAVRDVLLHQCPQIPLRNGMFHPAIGYGTYKVGFMPKSASAAVAVISTTTTTNMSDDTKTVERDTKSCVLDALKVGYRFLECAEFYGNEVAVGQAIQESGIVRSDLFLCSKVWTTTMEQGPDAIRAQLQQTLTNLQTNYVDLYLIHWPVPHHHVKAYQCLVELRNEGKIRGIGVSNYAWEDYVELQQSGLIADDDLPLVNQIEINPFLYRRNTISKFQQEGVILQSYRSLRDGKSFTDPVVQQIAIEVSRTPAQILGRWCLQKGFVYIPKSIQLSRMVENAAVFDFTLTEGQMQQLDRLTTPAAFQAYLELYRKCVNRDTSKAGTMDGVKLDITVD